MRTTSPSMLSLLAIGLLASAHGAEESDVPGGATNLALRIGPYPSIGQFDYEIRAAAGLTNRGAGLVLQLSISRDGAPVTNDTPSLDGGWPVRGRLALAGAPGPMPDGRYEISATLRTAGGEAIGAASERFERRQMPFEKEARSGVRPMVILPFEPPYARDGAVVVWGRRYQFGRQGLLDQVVAADRDLLAGTARLLVRPGHNVLMAFSGFGPGLRHEGMEAITYRQVFESGPIRLALEGFLDYDGFCRFRAVLTPLSGRVKLKELLLEIPLRAEQATLMNAVAAPEWPGAAASIGALGTGEGRLWDSWTHPFRGRSASGGARQSNMPPVLWVGDDERGLCYSCPSDRGMHNDPDRPAVALDREAGVVMLRIWFVNSPFECLGPREFEFALQASPFKPMPPDFRLERFVPRTDLRRASYQQRGRFYSGFAPFPGMYPAFGRWADLDRVSRFVDRELKSRSFSHVAIPAAGCFESGGTPEYGQFWREWGCPPGWDRRAREPLPPRAVDALARAGVTADGAVMEEAPSNASDKNIDYRVWWFLQATRRAGVDHLYQESPLFDYWWQPALGYGYIRDDGGREVTSSLWNWREFVKRVAQGLNEFHVDRTAPETPYVWPRLLNPAKPGGSFCRKALMAAPTGPELIPLDRLRVWFSKQWGMTIDWLMQTEAEGSTALARRSLCSRLFLLDATSFLGDADEHLLWSQALDIFWLDDPSVQWHPYYRDPPPASTRLPSTRVSAYTAQGRALFVVSNQSTQDVVECVALSEATSGAAGRLSHYYDAESGEEMEVENGAVRAHVPSLDYRLVLGFTNAWPFASRHLPGMSGIEPQSSLDWRVTVTESARQLLDAPRLEPVAGGHRLTERWLAAALEEMASSDAKDTVFHDRRACEGLDLGANGVQCSLLCNAARDIVLVSLHNPSDTDRILGGRAWQAMAARGGCRRGVLAMDPVRGTVCGGAFVLRAHSGAVVVLYADAADRLGPRRGPFRLGTMMSRTLRAVMTRRHEMQGR